MTALTLHDAAQLALDYIEQTAKFVPHTHDQAGCDVAGALRTALAQQGEQQPPFDSKRKEAMVVYTPPFKYLHGYIYDSQNLMVADDGDAKFGVEGAVVARVRGWGRFGYMPNGAELQDEIGQMMADALNAFYAGTAAAPAPAAQQLTQTQVVEGFCSLPHDVQYVSVFEKGVRFAERHHRIGVQK